jgi:formate dehydrogenase (coenzyme F420) alpha subunit
MKADLYTAPTICPYCTSGCGVNLVIKEGKIVGEIPRKDYLLNEGKTCIKGNNAFKYLSHPNRLKTPLVNGKSCSWDDALSYIAEKLKQIMPEEFGVLASGKTSNEESYLLQKFTRAVMHTSNIDYCARFCHSATVAGLGPAVGSGVMQTSQLDLDKADCIIAAGVNLSENFPGIARRIRRSKQKGTKVIVIDPRVTMTARNLGDLHLQLIPGTDAELLNAMLKIIIDKGYINNDFISKRTVGFKELQDYLADFDLKQAEKNTGISLKDIEESAALYAKANKGCILYDEGIVQHISGSDNIKLLADLVLLTGHIGKPGTGVNPLRGQISGEGSGDMGCVNVFYPGFKRVNDSTAKHFEKLWGVENLPDKPGKSYMDIINSCKAIYVVGVNPMLSAPDSNFVKKALEKTDLLIVQDIFLTETAELADVVLPAATWVERDGTHTGIDRRVLKINKIIEPPGQAKPDWWIISNLAYKMGHEKEFHYSTANDIFEEICKCIPQYSGLSYERLEKSIAGIHWPCPSADHPGTPTMFEKKFNTPDGMGHFHIVEYKPPAEIPDKDYPYVLITGRVIFHYHTASMTGRTDSLVKESPDGFVQIHPKDAARLGIIDGEKVIVTSRRGKIEVKTRLSINVQTGVVFIPFHFGKTRANMLTNPAFDPACKMPEFKVCAINIEKKESKK